MALLDVRRRLAIAVVCVLPACVGPAEVDLEVAYGPCSAATSAESETVTAGEVGTVCVRATSRSLDEIDYRDDLTISLTTVGATLYNPRTLATAVPTPDSASPATVSLTGTLDATGAAEYEVHPLGTGAVELVAEGLGETARGRLLFEEAAAGPEPFGLTITTMDGRDYMLGEPATVTVGLDAAPPGAEPIERTIQLGVDSGHFIIAEGGNEQRKISIKLFDGETKNVSVTSLAAHYVTVVASTGTLDDSVSIRFIGPPPTE